MRAHFNCCSICVKWGHNFVDYMIEHPYATVQVAAIRFNMTDRAVRAHRLRCTVFAARFDLIKHSRLFYRDDTWPQSLLDLLRFNIEMTVDEACASLDILKNKVHNRIVHDRWFALELKAAEHRQEERKLKRNSGLS